MATIQNPICDVSQNLNYFPQRVIQTDQAGNAYASQDLSALLSISGSSASSTQTATNQTNYMCRGVIVVFNVTALTGTNLTLTIQGVDGASGVAYTLLAGSAVTTTGTYVYVVYPGASGTGTASLPLPHTWNVKVVPSSVTSATYTVGASVIL
jgi:hypothetical protein